MSGAMKRLLTTRDKSSHRRSKSSEPRGDKPRPLSGNGIFQLFKPADNKPADKILDKKTEKSDAKKVIAIKHRLYEKHIFGLEEPQIEYALQTKYAEGDVDKASEILELFQYSVDGKLIPYNPKIDMVGAENRQVVTCWLDALLFSMFARLPSFEQLLYSHFDDEPRRRLQTLIRIWVNMLRSGKLIQTDITKHLQEALKACGWAGAAEICQQDASEAFGFITETLQLPLLTLEVDIFHEGKTDAADDHKFINERLLEVAVPPEPEDGKSIRLEDCLEDHFSTRVEIVRQMERRNTLQRMASQSSTRSGLVTVDGKIVNRGAARTHTAHDKDEDENEGTAEHVEDSTPIVEEPTSTHLPEINTALPTVNESAGSDRETDSPITEVKVVEVQDVDEKVVEDNNVEVVPQSFVPEHIEDAIDPGPQTPVVQSPTTFSNSPNSATPIPNRTRSTSFVRRYTLSPEEPGEASADGASIRSSIRKGSIRKEVLMPAWQFFKIIPWYTNKVPKDDVQVAAHFNQVRPVLGMCLKRYGWNREGRTTRRNTAIDIPLQIALPTFVQDDKASESGALFGNFVLKLQSVVCHRGNSPHHGHYISLVREEYQNNEEDAAPRRQSTDSLAPPEYAADRWLRHDDLAVERVQYVDIDKAMKEEMPYLLFYQVQPIYPDPPREYLDLQPLPPSYKDLGINIQESTPITPGVNTSSFFDRALESPNYFDPSRSTLVGSTTTIDEPARSRVSFSDDVERPATNNIEGRRSINLSDWERRGSLATDTSNASNLTTSQPATPGEDTSSRLSRAASIFGRRGASKSRPTSHVDENRIGDGRLGNTFSRLSLNLINKPNKDQLLEKQKSGESSGTSAGENGLAEIVERFRDAQEKEALEAARNGANVEVVALPTVPVAPATGLIAPSGIGRSLSKRAKKDKNKGSDSTATAGEGVVPEKHHGHHHTHSHGAKDKGKGKDKESGGEKDDEKERQCTLM